ncbi:MAG TPA: ABC transporter substrate-binding protein, partial [Anaerolineae bacterium]|nr:ABC transporter substrate-binding protein [Anaerolineae bacterium]
MNKISRREFIHISALATAGIAVAACAKVTEAPKEAGATPKPAEATAAAPPVSKQQQAPMLAELVQAGKLPPVEERLPTESFVVGPGVLIAEEDLDWEPGTYGGTLRFVHLGVNWNPDIFIMDNENLLAAPGIALEGLYPNVVQDYQVSDDNTEFTFTLRKGMKWSDGVPVTTEDVRFVFEDVYGDESLTPSFPAKFREGGRVDSDLVKVTIVDDFTWKMTFKEPYGGLLRELADKGWQGYTDSLRPSHYLKQYHIKYTPLDDPKMKEQLDRLNLTNEWWQVFAAMNCNNWDLTNPKSVNYPVLYAWMAVPGADQLLVFERNPYYWKVDTEGQQLPYIGKLMSQQVMDIEALTLKVLAGEVDYIRESTGLNKLPLYKKNEESAGIKFNLMDNHVDPSALFINYGYDDANWRKVVWDVRFRLALTHGLNRQEITDSIYYGIAQFPELIPSEYDVVKANQLLDD